MRPPSFQNPLSSDQDPYLNLLLEKLPRQRHKREEVTPENGQTSCTRCLTITASVSETRQPKYPPTRALRAGPTNTRLSTETGSKNGCRIRRTMWRIFGHLFEETLQVTGGLLRAIPHSPESLRLPSASIPCRVQLGRRRLCKWI